MEKLAEYEEVVLMMAKQSPDGRVRLYLPSHHAAAVSLQKKGMGRYLVGHVFKLEKRGVITMSNVKWVTEYISLTKLPDGRIYLRDAKRDIEGARTPMQAAEYIREHSKSPDHVPLGTALHGALKWLGFRGCLPCAERQAKLDRAIRRR